MSKEGAEGASGGEEQVKDLETELQQYKKKLKDAVKDIKDLETKLKQYEEDATKHAKDLEMKELGDDRIKEEMCHKLQESAKEKDRLIKMLIQKLQATEEELKEAKITHKDRMSKAINDNVSKDSQIAQLVKKSQNLQEKLTKKEAEVEVVKSHAVHMSTELTEKEEEIAMLINKITSLEEKLQQQIQEAKEKLEEEQQICRVQIEEVNQTCAQRTKEIRREVEEQLQIVRQNDRREIAKEVVKEAIMEIPEIKTICQQLEAMNQKIDKISKEKEESSIPTVITTNAVAESNPTGTHSYGFCTLSNPSSDYSVEPHLDSPIQETYDKNIDKDDNNKSSNDEDDKN
ncbi:PREDICTED: myosin-11-like [Amphimedon queenslandica]|uniref:Uncharacterized protein n=1 Tax=Amphimedon queenslandica TaxID=400682 RepID=A0A1X7TWP1_AMPQE|nr:PREDICTED: myosin-11-like [Amphimedon queenslandica]|eukprot:XP_019857265.1 PREDICTED: myosin-11-like [Amphimedon queenslandica]